MSTYAITGAAGFIGSHLAEALVADGASVIGIDRFTPYYPRDWKEANVERLLGHRRFRLMEADLVSADLDDLFEEVDGVYHLAAQAGVRGSWGEGFDDYVHDNVHATQRLFDAASRAGVRVVYASSSSVYGNALCYPTTEETLPQPISPYGITKLTCEHLARAYGLDGLDAVGMRYFTVYGPRQRPDMAFTRLAAALLTDSPFEVYGDGTQSRDVTYVADAVSATIAGMRSGVGGAIYNVGGGSETTLARVIDVFEDLAGRPLAASHREVARGDVRRTASDNTALRGDTGWRPRVGVEEGVAAQFEWARGISHALLRAAVPIRLGTAA